MSRVLLVLLAVWLLLLCVPRSPAAEPDGAADEQTLKTSGVAVDGAGLLDFFRTRTLAEPQRSRVLALIRKLGADEFQDREQASADLVALGATATPLLRQALRDTDVEVARRSEKCLQQIEKTPGNQLAAAAARIAARRKPAGLAEALLAYLPFADDEEVADEVRAALAAVAFRNGQPDAALLRALDDKAPLLRAAAGEAFLRGGPTPLPAARKLLQDPDAAVRLRAAVALAERKDRDAFPVLIAVLADVPRAQAWKAEDLLCRLAGEQAPPAPVGEDAAARQKCRDAWMAWWQKEGAKVDLARLDAEALLGFNLVVFMDGNFANGQVAEFGKDGKARWQIQGLAFPVDAQVLPGDKVLVAEANGMRVTERNFEGKVLWERKFPTQPVACQRLANGNTFVATRNQLLEVDRDGKEVSAINRPNHDILGARRLRNGQTALVTSTGTCVRLDAAGKEEKSFGIGQGLSFSGIDLLPTGRVLVPLYSSGKVVEYDADGKVVWEAAVQNPTSAVRLPDGNTLVASMMGQQLLELDRSGRKVWEQKIEGRPWRGSRR